ncbi:YbhB/YbcL family Raf kinase inhibitor-like protein [Rhodobacteraceae bacterium KMM 6894]|nr:YbhB/YbcL family Raf kinase inhibitor-like protein [Rhodobacteraceae bacterium KMM 6894]
MRLPFRLVATNALLAMLNGIEGAALAEQSLTLTSAALEEGGSLPADLKCTRDGGEGISPPLEWTGVPSGTKGFALIMHHYPRGAVEGSDAPSQYWLLWNIPAGTREIPRGNPASLGDQGSDKDGNFAGYTPPCSPGAAEHEYTITLFALAAAPETLPHHDSNAVDWARMTTALKGMVIAQSSLTFRN